MVSERATTQVARLMEGMCFADEVMLGVERIQTAAAIGNRATVVFEAGRLGHRAEAYRAELQRLAKGLDR